MENQALLYKKAKKEVNILNKRSKGEKIAFAVVCGLFMLYSLTMIFALAWMLINSLKGPLEYAKGTTVSLPETMRFSNYSLAFETLNVGNNTFADMLLNSIWYTLLGVGLTCFVPAVTGYVLAKYEFRGKQIIFTLAILSMTLPIVGGTAAYMRLMHRLDLFDSPMYVVVANLGGFSGTFLVYNAFFKGVSWSYAEAAILDGANPFIIFFRIMLPQAKSIILTYAITNAIAFWNEYQAIILYLPSFPTIASGLFEFKANATRMANYPVYFAGLIISMIPTLILFSAFSGRIMTSLSVGGLKG